MPDIENLNIAIASNVDPAIDGLLRLINVLERVKRSMRGADVSQFVSSLRQIKEEADDTTRALRGLASAVNRTNKVLNNASAKNYTSKMRDVADATNTATTAIARQAKAVEYAQSMYAQFSNTLSTVVRSFNSFGSGIGGNGGIPLLTGQEPIYTTFVEDAQGADDLSDAVEDMGSSVQKATRHFVDFKAVLNSIKEYGKDASKIFGKLAIGFKGIGTGLLSTTKPFATLPKLIGGSFVESIKNAKSSFDTLLSSIGRIAFYRFVRGIIKFITQGFKEGVENLYAWSNAVDKTFANSMDKLATSSLYLKNSLAAMAAPLINAIAPAIDYIVDKLVDMFNLVNQFFARLAGQTTYTAAKKVATVWDDATDKTLKGIKDTNKELQKTILSFDEINKLNGEANGSTGTGSGTSGSKIDASNMFETRPITNSINGLMEKLKGIFDVFKKAWQQEGAATIAAAKAAFNTLKNAAIDVANTFYDVFTAGYGFDWVVSGLHLLQSMFGVIVSIGEAFRTAWNDNGKGYNVLASFFTMLTNINDLITSINKSFSAAWDNRVGVNIMSNLLDIATNLNNIYGNLAQSINRAWNASGIGVAIWAGLLAIVNTILTSVNNISKSVADWAASLNFEPLLKAFNGLLESINPVVELITNGLYWAYVNVLEPFGKWTIEAGLPAVIDLLSSAFGLLSSVLSALKEPAKYIWDNFLEPIGKWVADTAISALNGISDALSGLSKWIDEHQEAFTTITEVVGVFLGSWLGATAVAGIISGIANAATTLAGAFALLTSAINPVKLAIVAVIALGYLLIKNWDKVVAAWEWVKEKFSEVGEAIKSAVDELKKWGTEIADDLSSTWQDAQTFAAQTWDAIKTGASDFTSWVSDTFGPIWDAAWSGLKGAWDNLKTDASGAWNNVVTVTDNVGKWIGDTFKTQWENSWNAINANWEVVKEAAKSGWKNVKEGLNTFLNWIKSTFKSGWSSAWDSIVNKFGSLFAKIKNKVKEPINAVIGFINSMIEKIESAINTIINGINNSLRITIPAIGFYDPIWGNWVGTSEWSWDGPNLPTVSWNRVDKLAGGGIVDRTTLLGRNGNKPIVAGESGKEAVLPLENHTEWMDVLADKVSSNGDNLYMIADYIQSGMRDSTYQQNELLREQNRILQQLLDKPFTAEVTTNSIVSGLQRKNRRDGTTVVPVLG